MGSFLKNFLMFETSLYYLWTEGEMVQLADSVVVFQLIPIVESEHRYPNSCAHKCAQFQ